MVDGLMPDGLMPHDAHEPRLGLVPEQCLFAVNREGIICAWDATAERFTGYSAAHMLGQPLAALVIPREPCASTSSPSGIVPARLAWLVRPDGRRESLTFATLSWPGDPTVTACLLQRTVASGLEDVRDLPFRSLVDLAPDGIAMFHEHRVIYANQAAADLVRAQSPRDLLGLNVMDFVHPDDLAAIQVRAQAVMADRKPLPQHVVRLLRFDGEYIHVESCVGPCDVGGTLGYQVIARDVTTRLHAEAQLQQQLHLQVEAQRLAEMGFFEWRMADNRLTWSDGLYRIYGITPEQFGGTLEAFLERVHADDRALVQATIARAFSAGGSFQLEERIIHAQGETRILESRGRVVFDDRGDPAGVIGACLDITDRKRAEQRLRESEQRFRDLADAMPQIVWVVDSSGKVTYTNRAFRAVLSGGDSSMSWEMVHPDDRQGAAALWDESLQSHTPFFLELRIQVAPGDYRWFLARAVPVPDPRRGDVLWYGAATDIHELKQAEASLRRSETHWRAFFATSNAGMSETAPDGRFLLANDAFCDMLGYPQSELLTMNLRDILPTEDRERAMAEFQKLSAGELLEYRSERRYRRKDGSLVSAHVHASVAQFHQGKPASLAGVVIDITDLQRAEGRLRSVLGSVTDAILTTDAQGIISSANAAAETIFGYPEFELLGKPIRDLLPDFSAQQPIAFSRRFTNPRLTMPDGPVSTATRQDGTSFACELIVSEFVLDGEKQFTCVVRDISARKALEEKIRQSHKIEAVGRLAAGVAHDFNNMLTVINGYTEIMLHTTTHDDPLFGPLTAIRDAGDRASRLTSQLLAFSRKAVVEPRLLDVNTLVTQAERLLRRLIGEDIILTVETSPGLPKIRADAGQMEQVIMNLVLNARDAMPTGGRLAIGTGLASAAEIAAWSGIEDANTATSHYVTLTVRDSGCGMSESVQSRIFEPFFTTKKVGEGTGLGLAVVHGIVNQNGGQIRVESQLGGGSQFRLAFPAAPEGLPHEATEADRDRTRGSETILLVEDEEAVRQITAITLETHGYRVIVSSGGPEALNLLRNFSGTINLLVTDVVMPVMSGRQVAQAVREKLPSVKVLYMSGYTDDAIIQHGVIADHDSFLAKPFTPAALARKVRMVLDHT